MGSIKYYLGTGTEFIRTQCKEYKTLDGALKAAAKDETLVVWDEDGKMVGSLTDDVPEGVLVEEENTEDAFGKSAQTEMDNNHNVAEDSAEPTKNETEDIQMTKNIPPKEEKVENEANTEHQEKKQEGDTEKQDAEKIIIPQGTMKVTVICDGAINLRRTASWKKGNECGRASRGQAYYVKTIHEIEGKKMVETVDGIFLSGQSEHVQFEQMQ